MKLRPIRGLVFLLVTLVFTLTMLLIDAFVLDIFYPMFISDLSEFEYLLFGCLIPGLACLILISIFYSLSWDRVHIYWNSFLLVISNVLATAFSEHILCASISWVSILFYFNYERRFLSKESLMVNFLVTFTLVLCTIASQIRLLDLTDHIYIDNDSSNTFLHIWLALCFVPILYKVSLLLKRSIWKIKKGR